MATAQILFQRFYYSKSFVKYSIYVSNPYTMYMSNVNLVSLCVFVCLSICAWNVLADGNGVHLSSGQNRGELSSSSRRHKRFPSPAAEKDGQVGLSVRVCTLSDKYCCRKPVTGRIWKWVWFGPRGCGLITFDAIMYFICCVSILLSGNFGNVQQLFIVCSPLRLLRVTYTKNYKELLRRTVREVISRTCVKRMTEPHSIRSYGSESQFTPLLFMLFCVLLLFVTNCGR